MTGRVSDAQTSTPLAAATVRIDGTEIGALTDSAGRYRIVRVPPGPQVLVVEHLGYATARVAINVPTAGVLARDVQLAASALALPSLTVTAEPAGRARGELGTASVIGREAIEVQSAASLAGVLELVPGVELRPPGLEGVQQFSLRSVPTSGVTSLLAGGPSAGDVGSFGTLIVLDGVPLSNNANLQTLGPRGELPISSSANGGIDLRRLPASTLERVEVIRGVPSARYGDLTQGVIVVDTRAGAYEPDARGMFDPHNAGGTLRGGWSFSGPGALSANADLTRTRTDPGFRRDEAYRFASQLSHRALLGGDVAPAEAAAPQPRLTLDSRLDLFQVYEESPEDSAIAPGVSSSSRDRGVRLSERARLRLGNQTVLEFTGSLDYTGQRSTRVAPRSRGATPFTDRLTEGRAFGRYIGGEYSSQLAVEGEAWNLFSRLEGERRGIWLGLDHTLRLGAVLRREWNTGAGYQFDIEFPPQASFNGVEGFDRPRPFDAVPPMASSALYVDERAIHVLPGGIALDLQAGVRLDALHEGGHWFSGARDVVLQPRLNAQVSPWDWLRLRAGWGRTAKLPTLGQIYPPPQYFDVINVNWFANNPVERLAVLTTFIQDPSNEDVGLAVGQKAEAGFELASRGGEASLAVVAFQDRTEGAIGFRPTPGMLLRDRYALADSVIGDERPTEILEPPTHADTIPILLDVPANTLTLENEGLELTARLPEIRPLRLRVEVQGAWTESVFRKDGPDFGRRFSQFQVDERIPRSPFWESITNTGTRGLATYRLIHHQPRLGFVVTATIQHVFRETRQNVGANDSLAFEGYITRSGEMVPVPPERRSDPEFADLRTAREGLLFRPTVVAPDWFASLRLSMTLPLDGRLSFYAFNAFDRTGKQGDETRQSRFHPSMRFGLEGTLPLGRWLGGR